MRTKLTILFITSFLSLALLGLYLVPSAPPPKNIDLKVIKLNGVWKVVDATDSSKIVVKVKKNDKITWTVIGTDASFQFPQNLLDPVDPADSLKNGYTKSLKDGKTLKLKVKSNAKAETYEYSVYCTADEVFAVGGSPPKIIVE
jgi:hypothetical protein